MKNEFKKQIKEMMCKDYKAFCEALFEIELGESVDSELLYLEYMSSDSSLLNCEDLLER